jgi:hypothetical protein
LKLDICKLTFEDINLSPRYSEKIRGYLGNKYKEKDLLHNHKESKFIYRYPLVQYKVISGKPIIIGINKGSELVANIGILNDELILDGVGYSNFQKGIIMSSFDLESTDDYIEYEFITPWIALNQDNSDIYNKSNSIQKDELLKKILIGNIISMSKGLGYTVEEKLYVWIDVREVEVNLKNIKHKAFKGKFKVNFRLPDYIGIGKSVSRGFGTVKKLANSLHS